MSAAPPSSLWHELKVQSQRSRQQARGVSGARPFGSLTGILSSETEKALQNSGALHAMQTPSHRLRPLAVICETTNLCNSDCVFCPNSLQTRSFGTMEPELFEEVCRQYAAMGGGPFSLTPVVGDVLLDKDLPSRLATLRRYRHSLLPGLTTNLYALDRHSDDVVSEMLETFARIHISVYGITPEENAQITRRNHFRKFALQARRIATLWERSSQRCSLWVSFRNLYEYPRDTLLAYVGDHFGHPEWCQGDTTRYSNWGGRMTGALPGDAQWVSPVENHKTCILLTIGLQVYWDGRVSACCCCDYDAAQELALGSVREHTLTEIYNSAANRQLWAEQESGNVQGICRHCTFHVPISELNERRPFGARWFDFSGG